MKCFTIEEINKKINGKLTGNPAILITGVDQVADAKESQLTFIGEKKYIKLWQQSSASAAIVNDGLNIEPGPDHALIFVSDADLALAQVLEMFEPEPPKCEVGIHSTAVIDSTANIGAGAAIGAGCYRPQEKDFGKLVIFVFR